MKEFKKIAIALMAILVILNLIALIMNYGIEDLMMTATALTGSATSDIFIEMITVEKVVLGVVKTMTVYQIPAGTKIVQ